MQQIQSIAINKIEVGQHRQRSEDPDERLQELTASIRRVGVLVPLIVVRHNSGYILLVGHRRIAAATAAGLAEVPAIVRESNEAENAEVSFAENFFRSDLSPVEQAAAIRECIDNGIMTIEELAKGFHRKEQWITEQMNLTTWAPEVLHAIHNKRISVAAGRNLALIDDPQYRAFLLNNAAENGASARITAAWLQGYQLSRPPADVLTATPVDGPQPAAIIIPEAPCMFCVHVFRTDALNYMPVCPQCLANFQQAREKVNQPAGGG